MTDERPSTGDALDAGDTTGSGETAGTDGASETGTPDGLETEDHPPGAVRNDLAPASDGVDLSRRNWMRALGLTLLGGVGASATTGSAGAEPADPSLTVDERIEEHRTGGLEVVVRNPDGTPVEDAAVSVTQQEHEFGFGTAVNADTLLNQSSEGDEYREYVPELFNTAVLENRHKWAFWESERQLADDATEWLLDQGLDLRGHVCIWGRDGVSAIPDDVQAAIDQRDGATIRDRSMQHIQDIVTHYGEDVTEWEVVNEAMHAYQLQLGVYGDRIDQEQPWTGDVVPWTSGLLADWYDEAASVIEEHDLDVGIAVNDFNQFAYDYTDDRYRTEIEHIEANATQLDTIGLQAHAAARTGENDTDSNPDGRIGAQAVAEEMNQWADYGARLKITEFDTYNGDDWSSDQERADVLENYLRGAFSHPGCDAFLMWGFWDGRHWRNEAPLFYEDWSEKPAYDVWTGLVYDKWWTDETGATDASGTYATSAFLGEHEITVETATDAATATVTVDDAGGTTTVTVDVEGDGIGDDTEAPSTPANLSVTDATPSSIDVSWDASTDEGGSSLDHYAVTLDGEADQTVPADTTTATVDGLEPDASYEIGVSAVDAAGNESDAATVTATTDPDDGEGDPADALVVDDYDGSPAWTDGNDLGNWNGAGSFQNGGGSGEVVDGALQLQYDDAGWFVEQIMQDVSDYSELVLEISGASGGEGDQFVVAVGGVREPLTELTDDAISTSTGEVVVDMAEAGIDQSSPGELRLNFWEGASGASTVTIEEIRIE